MTSHGDPLPTVGIQNWNQTQANLLYLLVATAGLIVPGALLGALIAAALWTWTGDPRPRRILAAGMAAWLAIALHSLDPAWLWPILLDALSGTATRLHLPDLMAVATELLLGPALLLVLQSARSLRLDTALGQAALERERAVKRSRAIKKGASNVALASTGDDRDKRIRLGVDEFVRFFDLDQMECLQHIGVTGAPGSGKTTTIMRFAEGALDQGFAVVVVDCKGVGLSGPVRRLAVTGGVPLHVVDPDSEVTIGYDPCTGDAAHIANKLVGAFSFTGEAEIYKHVAMQIIPVIVRALEAAQQPVDLEGIYTALGKGGLARLARMSGVPAPLAKLLRQLEGSGGVGTAGYTGLQHRLGALIQGRFGPLFEMQPALNWYAVTAAQSIVYLSLSVTAASEDVELFARLITQDLKQLCDNRLRLIEQGEDLIPLMVVFDEFAALREPHQVVDLLLQARQARMTLVIATQYLPEEIPIRTPFLQSGILICHRVGAEDADAIAAEFGTHNVPDVTHQIDYETGYSEKGTIRMDKQFHIHPDILRELPQGTAAILVRASGRRAILHIIKS